MTEEDGAQLLHYIKLQCVECDSELLLFGPALGALKPAIGEEDQHLKCANHDEPVNMERVEYE